MTEFRFPSFAPSSGEAFSSADLVLEDLFGENFLSSDLEGLDFMKDLGSFDSSAFDMDELMDIGVEVRKREDPVNSAAEGKGTEGNRREEKGTEPIRKQRSRETHPHKDERRYTHILRVLGSHANPCVWLKRAES